MYSFGAYCNGWTETSTPQDEYHRIWRKRKNPCRASCILETNVQTVDTQTLLSKLQSTNACSRALPLAFRAELCVFHAPTPTAPIDTRGVRDRDRWTAPHPPVTMTSVQTAPDPQRHMQKTLRGLSSVLRNDEPVFFRFSSWSLCCFFVCFFAVTASICRHEYI